MLTLLACELVRYERQCRLSVKDIDISDCDNLCNFLWKPLLYHERGGSAKCFGVGGRTAKSLQIQIGIVE
jgi:hypothetical protein